LARSKAAETFFLGGKGLAVGGNNLSTEFSGSILDAGGSVNAVGGNFGKGGTGTLTLSGNNAYSGFTFVYTGTLRVTNPDGAALGTSIVQVAAGTPAKLCRHGQSGWQHRVRSSVRPDERLGRAHGVHAGRLRRSGAVF
jgi:autotransporter-associated beta strand protein